MKALAKACVYLVSALFVAAFAGIVFAGIAFVGLFLYHLLF